VRANGPAPRDLVKDPSCDNPIIPPYPYEPLAEGFPAAKKVSKSNSGGCEDGSKPSKVSGASGPSGRDPDGPEDSGGNVVGSSALGGKIIHITKNDMKDLLNSSGKSIHKKLGETLKGRTEGTIWNDRNFRVDAGQSMNDNASFRTWNLQVNKAPDSNMAKKYLLLKRGTDERLYWGKFNIENPPTYKEWTEAILAAWN
jgi:hypothetical protein